MTKMFSIKKRHAYKTIEVNNKRGGKMLEHRNRATGWRYAKLSGHTNEERVKDLVEKDLEYQKCLLKRIGVEGHVSFCDIGGLHEKNVPGVLGKSTKSKTDLKIYLDNKKHINMSVKKSPTGQVYFVRVGLFFDVFERQFQTIIPDKVKRAMNLFWSAADDADQIIRDYVKPEEDPHCLQRRHKSLNATTLKRYDIRLYSEMLDWFKENASNLAILSFSTGAAKNSADWADYVWYINTLEENDMDFIFPIKEIAEAANIAAEEHTYYGDTNGGTTIHLPFGFVQWHQRKMQFHHEFEKVKSLLS